MGPMRLNVFISFSGSKLEIIFRVRLVDNKDRVFNIFAGFN